MRQIYWKKMRPPIPITPTKTAAVRVIAMTLAGVVPAVMVMTGAEVAAQLHAMMGARAISRRTMRWNKEFAMRRRNIVGALWRVVTAMTFNFLVVFS